MWNAGPLPGANNLSKTNVTFIQCLWGGFRGVTIKIQAGLAAV